MNVRVEGTLRLCACSGSLCCTLLTVCEAGGKSFTLPSSTKTRDYHHTLSEEDWINWHQQSQSLLVIYCSVF